MTDTIHSCSQFCTLPACVEEGMRREFEAWFSEDGTVPEAITRKGENYLLMSTANAWWAWQEATERATAIERERCAVVCEVNQVAYNAKKGAFLVNWPIDSYGIHEGMTYAAAIRQGGVT